MKLAHPNVEYRLNDLQGMLYAACRLGAWCYGSERQFFMSTASHKEEYRKLLETGGCLDAAMARKDIPAKPFILSWGRPIFTSTPLPKASAAWTKRESRLRNGAII